MTIRVDKGKEGKRRVTVEILRAFGPQDDAMQFGVDNSKKQCKMELPKIMVLDSDEILLKFHPRSNNNRLLRRPSGPPRNDG